MEYEYKVIDVADGDLPAADIASPGVHAMDSGGVAKRTFEGQVNVERQRYPKKQSPNDSAAIAVLLRP
jgi:hypothetical protein